MPTPCRRGTVATAPTRSMACHHPLREPVTGLMLMTACFCFISDCAHGDTKHMPSLVCALLGSLCGQTARLKLDATPPPERTAVTVPRAAMGTWVTSGL